MGPQIVSASELRAKCYALLDEVAGTGVPLIVTKRGKKVAQIVPASAAVWATPELGARERRAKTIAQLRAKLNPARATLSLAPEELIREDRER